MEGPSLVIAVHELRPIRNKKVQSADGNSKLIDIAKLNGATFVEAQSWGKHLLLIFSNTILRIHFLMFGSYRIDDAKAERVPRLHLKFSNHDLYFYSCSIREISKQDYETYDKQIDIMSDEWNPQRALSALKKHTAEMVCDVLMNQSIFAGVGNIIKNEVLFRLKIHPEKKIMHLKNYEHIKLVEETKNYCEEFFEWKVLNILKRNWKIMRKKNCPDCETQLIRKKTGQLQRWSYFCPYCQPAVTQTYPTRMGRE